jgi:hypothetical protein
MTRVMIRTDTEPRHEFTAVFPHLTPHHDDASTTLVGELSTLHDVQVVLNTLDMLGIHICEVVALPVADGI